MDDRYLNSNIDLFVMSFSLHKAYTYIIPMFGRYMTKSQLKKYRKELDDKKKGKKKKKNKINKLN
jgi:hypothetical protein